MKSISQKKWQSKTWNLAWELIDTPDISSCKIQIRLIPALEVSPILNKFSLHGWDGGEGFYLPISMDDSIEHLPVAPTGREVGALESHVTSRYFLWPQKELFFSRHVPWLSADVDVRDLKETNRSARPLDGYPQSSPVAPGSSSRGGPARYWDKRTPEVVQQVVCVGWFFFQGGKMRWIHVMWLFGAVFFTKLNKTRENCHLEEETTWCIMI